MITVNVNNGGTAIVSSEYKEPPHRSQQNHWKKSWRFFGIYFTLSNCRTKMRHSHHDRTHALGRNEREMKAYRYKQTGGVCPMCGKQFDIKFMELHHVLPWARFPELRGTKANHLLLCHDCHKEIHCNPYLNIKMMEEKAKEFGIDLNEKYNV